LIKLIKYTFLSNLYPNYRFFDIFGQNWHFLKSSVESAYFGPVSTLFDQIYRFLTFFRHPFFKSRQDFMCFCEKSVIFDHFWVDKIDKFFKDRRFCEDFLAKKFSGFFFSFFRTLIIRSGSLKKGSKNGVQNRVRDGSTPAFEQFWRYFFQFFFNFFRDPNYPQREFEKPQNLCERFWRLFSRN
jgi:hypothetical protein